MSTPHQPLPEGVWRALAEVTSDAILVGDRDGTVRWGNAAAVRLYGADAVGRTIDAVIATRAVSRVSLPDGFELAIAREDRGFRAVIENSPDGIVVHHLGRAVYVNAALARMIGAAGPAELVGIPVADFVHPDDRARARERIRRLNAGEAVMPFAEERLLRRDGTMIDCSIAGIAVEFEGLPCVVAIARDVTDQRRLQARLVETDRMVALGTLSAGIAHEINNPLTYLILHVDALAVAAQKLGPHVDPAGKRVLDRLVASVAIAQEGAARVRDIVRDLRVFARANDDVRGPVDLRASVERALTITAHELRQRASVVTRLDPVPKVIASDGRLTQVFVNLLLNASYAVGTGDPEHHRIEIATWSDGEHALASVRDTGHGIPAALLPRIFEPFFTTKPVGEGSGLGLAMVHGIVTAAGGTVEVESRVGEGSTFTVKLPASSS